MAETTNTNENGNCANRVLGTVDYSKITLCPTLEYKCYCQICGKCDYCPMYTSSECKGCGANFKDESLNTKVKYENTKF